MSPYLIPIFEEVFEEFLLGSSITDFSLYRHSAESASDLLQDFYIWFYDENNSYISGIKEIKAESLNPSEEGVEILEELNSVLIYNKETGFKQGENIDFDPKDGLNENYKIEYSSDLELFTGGITKPIVVSVCIGQFIRVKVDGKLSSGFYHQSRFQSKKKRNKMPEISIFHGPLVTSLQSKELHGFKSLYLAELETFFVGERVWDKKDQWQEYEIESISSVSVIENKMYVINPVKKDWEAGTYKEKIDRLSSRTVFPNEISSVSAARDSNNLCVSVGDKISVKIPEMAFVYFSALNGWDTSKAIDKHILNQYRYLLQVCRFKVVDYKKYDLANDLFYIYGRIIVEDGDKHVFDKLKLTNVIFKFPGNYTTKLFAQGIYDSYNSETEVSRRKRLEEERVKMEKETVDKEFDKQHGPYTDLSKKYNGKLILVDWPSAEIDAMSGIVSEVDEEYGRVSIKLQNTKTYFFRQSVNQLEKHIKIISPIVVSSEENPELV